MRLQFSSFLLSPPFYSVPFSFKPLTYADRHQDVISKLNSRLILLKNIRCSTNNCIYVLESTSGTVSRILSRLRHSSYAYNPLKDQFLAFCNEEVSFSSLAALVRFT